MRPRLRCSEGPVSGLGARLQSAERLIRLGARAAVVNDALAITGPSRSLVRRMYIGIRGPGRPRGPLPFDHVELLATADARMEAAVFLDAWERLRAAGVAQAAALAGAWECFEAAGREAVHAARPLGIDQGWILARSLDQGALHRLTCDHCGCRYFDACLRPRRPGMPLAPVPAAAVSRPAHLRCPHCARARLLGRADHPVPAARAVRARHGAAPEAAPGRPAAVVVAGSHPLADLARRYAWAEALFREGARPPIVTHVTGLVMTGTLHQLYVEVVGHGPRQGALPQLGEHIIATWARKLQASVITVAAERLARAGHAPPRLLLETWRAYRSLFGTAARFDINAVALVLRARNHPDFTLVACRGCRCSYLELRLDITGSRCPVCRQLRQADAEAEWN